MVGYVLRDDQTKMVNENYESWGNGNKVNFSVATTGFGKSVVMSKMAKDIDQNGANQAILAHRKELVGQMAMHVARREIPHRIIGPTQLVRDIANEQREELGRSWVNPDARCTVAGVDTIKARADDLKSWANNIQYFHGDEGHHYLRSNKWGFVLDMFPSHALGSLVSACPRRADGMGLGRHAAGYADKLILGPTMRQSIDMGAITDYEIAVPDSDFDIDESAVGSDGDFTRGKMRDASKKSRIVGDVVAEYTKRAYGKRAICFATDTETAGEIAQKFNDAGIPAISLNGNTPANVRRDMIKRFKLGQIWVLVNVDLFDEGFDVPACEVVIMARPTASLNKYLQMIGRALRTMSGKLYGLIIDHVSNWKRHGLPDKPRIWSLDNAEKRAKKEPDPEDIPCTTCKACTRPYELYYPACPYCGHVPPLPEPGARTIQHVAGDLRLLDRDTLARMRAEMVLEDPDTLANRVAFVAGGAAGRAQANHQHAKLSAQKRLFDAIAMWAGIQRARGREDAESYRRYFYATGIDVLGSLHKDRTRQEYENLATIVEGWCNDQLQSV